MHKNVLLTRYVEGKEDQVEKVLYQLADINISEIPKRFYFITNTSLSNQCVATASTVYAI